MRCRRPDDRRLVLQSRSLVGSLACRARFMLARYRAAAACLETGSGSFCWGRHARNVRTVPRGQFAVGWWGKASQWILAAGRRELDLARRADADGHVRAPRSTVVGNPGDALGGSSAAPGRVDPGEAPANTHSRCRVPQVSKPFRRPPPPPPRRRAKPRAERSPAAGGVDLDPRRSLRLLGSRRAGLAASRHFSAGDRALDCRPTSASCGSGCGPLPTVVGLKLRPRSRSFATLLARPRA